MRAAQHVAVPGSLSSSEHVGEANFPIYENRHLTVNEVASFLLIQPRPACNFDNFLSLARR
jgi:hypothetical protein